MQLGMVGLGVMGRNLLLDLADHGHAVAAGVYVYRLETPTFTDSRRMVLVR